jgi:putative nucleotidyltransferase with HDIG domain
MSTLPTKEEARGLLAEHVTDTYQRFHAEMVARAVEGYAEKLGEDKELWWLTGYLHDIDYDKHPTEHPGPSLIWFKSWGYPQELIHAVEAHAFGFNGYTTKGETILAKALLACDEISGIFYAYQKLNPIPFGEMKASSIKKRLQDTRFAPGIDRTHIFRACEEFGITIDEHIANLIAFFAALPKPQ